MAPPFVRPDGREFWAAGISRATVRRAALTGVWHPVARPPNELATMAIKKSGRGVFQRLDDVDALFAQRLGGHDLVARRRRGTGRDSRSSFSSGTYSFTNTGSLTSSTFSASTARQEVGQRLVLGRRDGDQALDALKVVVQAIAVPAS